MSFSHFANLLLGCTAVVSAIATADDVSCSPQSGGARTSALLQLRSNTVANQPVDQLLDQDTDPVDQPLDQDAITDRAWPWPSHDAIPFGSPFYLKSAEHSSNWVMTEGGHPGDHAHIIFHGAPEGTARSMQFLAEDAKAGLFYLRSQESVEQYVHAEGNATDGMRLVWGDGDGRATFSIERTKNGSFYLKSGQFADAYVQADGGNAEENTYLVFAPFVSNVSIQFKAEAAELNEEDLESDEDVDACNLPLVGGRFSKILQDSALSASSQNDKDGNLIGNPHGWGPDRSRMDCNMSCWLSKENDQNQWIQWDFGGLKKIRKIETLGRPHRGKEGDDQWVSEYTLSYTEDDKSWTYLNESFKGNSDRNVTVAHELHPPLVVTKLRLHPTKWNSRIALRAELYGCSAVQAPSPSVCGACKTCEVVPGTRLEREVATKCPYCAYGMLTAWPCNVKGLCRCAKHAAPCGEPPCQKTLAAPAQDVPVVMVPAKAKEKFAVHAETKAEAVLVPEMEEVHAQTPCPTARVAVESTVSAEERYDVPVKVVPFGKEIEKVSAKRSPSSTKVVKTATASMEKSVPVVEVPDVAGYEEAAATPCPTAVVRVAEDEQSTEDWVEAKAGDEIKA